MPSDNYPFSTPPSRALLQAEADHRIANSLQIVATLLLAQSHEDGTAASAALQRAYSRVMAVAELHKQLSRMGTGSAVRFDDYLHEIARLNTDALTDQASPVVLVNADPFTVSSDVAVTLGLITSELLVNALKHARAKGPIVVSIDAGVDRNGDLAVTVSDNGDPERPRAKHALPGIGTGLVMQLVRQVSGIIEYEPLMRGRRIRISVPLSAYSPLHASGIAG